MSDDKYTATGHVLSIGDAEQVSDKFRKRSLILEIGDKYPQPIEFEAANDKCELYDSLRPGDQVVVHFNLRGRKWDGPKGTRYFVSLSAWRVENLSASAGTARPPEPSQDHSDLPF